MKLTKIKLNGLDFWYRSDDKFVGQRIALGKYEEYETLLMMSQIDGNSVAVDVGANIGYYTLLLAQKCKWVYAFEPDKECFEILKKNTEENNLKNVKIFNMALSDKKEKREIIKDESNQGNSRLKSQRDCHIAVATAPRNDELVLCEKLDEILKNEGKIDLIKIDTQGWEPEVIQGAGKIIKRDSPVLFLEYTPSEYTDESMIDFLKSIYENIWSIDYWFYVARRGIGVNKKTGYVDLWLKNKLSVSDWLMTIRHWQWKKTVREIATACGLAMTK